MPGRQRFRRETLGVRVLRYFAFVDLSGFTSFSDEQGDEESVEVLAKFRAAARKVATDFGVRIAKWLGDGCMFVSVDPRRLVQAVLRLDKLIAEADIPLEIHAGLAGGAVILLEGDDYTGGPVNLASRLCDVAGAHQLLATVELGELAPPGAVLEPVGRVAVRGFRDPVEVVRIGRNQQQIAAS